MRKISFCISLIIVVIVSSCVTKEPIKKSIAYKGMYSEKPLTVLLMPPINRSTNVDAKQYFHSTLNIPLSNQGFYIVPPFLSMEILRKESAYDTEMFLNSPLAKFGEVFGADVALFTIIHKWNKSYAHVIVEVEYIVKSIKTNEILFERHGEIDYNTAVSTNAGGIAGLIADIALTAINTATTKYVDVAKSCNLYTFRDLPVGKYNTLNNLDGEELAGDKVFFVRLNSQYQ